MILGENSSNAQYSVLHFDGSSYLECVQSSIDLEWCIYIKYMHILDSRSQRAGSYKFGAVIVNV